MDAKQRIARSDANDESRPLKERVEEWLRSEGYPFELEVAQMFRDADWAVEHAVPYTDPVTGKIREIDLTATLIEFTDVMNESLATVFAVECKSSRDKPWVVFKPSQKGGHSQEWTPGTFGPTALNTASPTVGSVPFKALFSTRSKPAHGAVRAFGGKTTADPTGAFSAIHSALTAANALQNAYDREALAMAQGGRAYHISFFAPIVVIDANLFECKYAKGMTLTEIGSSLIQVATHQGDALVWIVTKAELPAFLRLITPDMMALCQGVSAFARKIITDTPTVR